MEDGFYWPTKGSGDLQHHKFVMENSILKIFGSVDVKINPENVIKRYGADVLRLPDGRSELIFVTYDL